MATRVECDEESDGFGGKCDGNEGGRRLMATRAMATVTATTWLMATVTRLAGDEEGKGEGGKGDGDGDEGGGRRRGNVDGGKSDGDGGNGGRRAMVMATKRVMVTATRVGEVGGRRNGQWRWRDSKRMGRQKRERGGAGLGLKRPPLAEPTQQPAENSTGDGAT